MASTNYPYFSRPGWLPFAVLAVLAAIIWYLLGFIWSVPVWLLCALVIYLFRDPGRDVPAIPLAVISPADGIVSEVDVVADPYIKRQAIRVAIDMNHSGVYSARSPIEGKILDIKDGSLDADGIKRPHGVWIQTVEQDDIVVAMHRGSLNSMPRCYIQIGEKIGQGQRCGHIRFGGRVEIYLPENSRVVVATGSRVEAGSSVIATLVHK